MSEQPKKILTFSEISKLPTPLERQQEALRLWDALLSKALQKGDFAAALKIAESANEIMRRNR